jgi:hypothetical protein
LLGVVFARTVDRAAVALGSYRTIRHEGRQVVDITTIRRLARLGALSRIEELSREIALLERAVSELGDKRAPKIQPRKRKGLSLKARRNITRGIRAYWKAKRAAGK